MRDRACLLLLLAMTLVACDGRRESPTSPTRPIVPSSPFVGTWSGPIVDEETGGGQLRLTITEQIERSLFGSWTMRFPDETLNDGGPITAFVNASSSNVFLLLSSASSRTCPVPVAPATISASLTVASDRMTGEFTSLGCTPVRAGTLELVKQ